MHLPDAATVLLDIAAWGMWSGLAGYLAHRRVAAAFGRDTRLTRLRPFEAGGRWYERRVRIRAWKDRLPEAGALFAGGVSKRRIGGRGRDVLERFVVETRRAEWAHWLIMAAAPAFFLWNSWPVGVAMIGYALAANLPCLLVQRYNRARLLRTLARARGAPQA